MLHSRIFAMILKIRSEFEGFDDTLLVRAPAVAATHALSVAGFWK